MAPTPPGYGIEVRPDRMEYRYPDGPVWTRAS
jgi:hypothetical protein